MIQQAPSCREEPMGHILNLVYFLLLWQILDVLGGMIRAAG